MNVPREVIDGITEALRRYESGVKTGRTFTVEGASAERIKQLRAHRLKMTQQEFAISFGIPIRTLQKWEQGAREPEGPARAYLAVIERIPEQVISALRLEMQERVGEI